MYVNAPTGKSKEELDALLFDKATRRNRTDPYEREKGIVGLELRRSKHGGRLAEIGWHSLKHNVYRLPMTSRRY